MDLWVKPVILNPSTVTPGPSHVILNPSDPVILSKAKDLILLRVNSVKSLRTSAVKDLRDSSPECPEQSLRFFGSASE